MMLESLERKVLDKQAIDWHFDGLVQKRRNSIANALELRLSCPNLSIWSHIKGRMYRVISIQTTTSR